MRKAHRACRQGDLMRQGSLANRSDCHGFLQPSFWSAGELQTPSLMEQYDLPGAHRRYPKFISGIFDCANNTASQPVQVRYAPHPDVGVQQQPHSRPASHSSSLEIGDTMSPMISAVPAMDPNQLERRFGAGGGNISAKGTPNRVTSTGLRVFRTRSSTDRHVALNLETAICSMSLTAAFMFFRVYHGQRPWSILAAPGSIRLDYMSGRLEALRPARRRIQIGFIARGRDGRARV